jgi:hypothetical protein
VAYHSPMDTNGPQGSRTPVQCTYSSFHAHPCDCQQFTSARCSQENHYDVLQGRLAPSSTNSSFGYQGATANPADKLRSHQSRLCHPKNRADNISQLASQRLSVLQVSLFYVACSTTERPLWLLYTVETVSGP